MVTGHAVVAYIATNLILAMFVGWLEPLRLALKEMGWRQAMLWLAIETTAFAIYWWGFQ